MDKRSNESKKQREMETETIKTGKEEEEGYNRQITEV